MCILEPYCVGRTNRLVCSRPASPLWEFAGHYAWFALSAMAYTMARWVLGISHREQLPVLITAGVACAAACCPSPEQATRPARYLTKQMRGRWPWMLLSSWTASVGRAATCPRPTDLPAKTYARRQRACGGIFGRARPAAVPGPWCPAVLKP